jgi:hypothetical protein
MAGPDETPVTTPEEETVAIDGLLLLHVPPDGVDDNALVTPRHTTLLPLIAEGLVQGGTIATE